MTNKGSPLSHLCLTMTYFWKHTEQTSRFGVCRMRTAAPSTPGNEVKQKGRGKASLQMPSSGPGLPKDRLVLDWAAWSGERRSGESISWACNRNLHLGPCCHSIPVPASSFFLPAELQENREKNFIYWVFLNKHVAFVKKSIFNNKALTSFNQQHPPTPTAHALPFIL